MKHTNNAMNVDRNKLDELIMHPLQPAGANELRRSNDVFFVGGELPIDETLETMFESFCTESTELFHLSFGTMGSFQNSEAMARQIKKNFHIRLMGRLNEPASAQTLERIYAAGVDVLDIPLAHFTSGKRDHDRRARYDALLSARGFFPRWSVASTLLAGEESPVATMNGIDELLKDGIVPLVALAESATGIAAGALSAVFEHLASAWEQYRVPMQPFFPIIGFMMPLTPKTPSGPLRGMIDKFHDRRRLAASDLRRHLRLKVVEDSMDSAAL